MKQDNIESIAKKLCPNDSRDNPAFPNHTDTDIWEKGFIEGFKYLLEEILEIQYIVDKEEFNKNPSEWVEQLIENMQNLLNNRI